MSDERDSRAEPGTASPGNGSGPSTHRIVLSTPDAAADELQVGPTGTMALAESDTRLTPSEVAPPSGALQRHEKLGPFTVTGFLGRGGMALVYAAVDGDGSPVALKVMQETAFVPAGMLQRFLREANAAKRLRRHPHIVTVYDTGSVGNDHYIAMELVPGGKSLEHLLAAGPVSIRTAMDIGISIAKALEYAHNNGVVHRDIKPGNVLINEFDEALLADFGLARTEISEAQGLTLSAVAMGTPRYMSPEQTSSIKQTTHRSDIYSLGVVLHEILTGRLPYDLTSDMGMADVFEVIRRQEARNPRRYRREISRNLAAVLLKMLAKEPGHRYESMAAAVRDLEACADGHPVSVRIPSVFERFERCVKRHRATAASVAVAVVAVVGVWRLYERRFREERQAALLYGAESEGHERELATLRRQLDGTAPLAEEDLLVAAAQAVVEDGDMAEAERLLTAVLERVAASGVAPERSGFARAAAWRLARLALVQGHYEIAAERYERLRDSPHMPKLQRGLIRFEAGLVRQFAGDAGGAHEEWQQLIESLDPDAMLIFLAHSFHRRRFPVAADTFRRLVAELPDGDRAFYLERLRKATELSAAGRHPEAIAIADELLATLAPQYGLVLLCHGALGHFKPDMLIQCVDRMLPSIRALGYWLASEQVLDLEQKRGWQKTAMAAAKTALPWLYYRIVRFQSTGAE